MRKRDRKTKMYMGFRKCAKPYVVVKFSCAILKPFCSALLMNWFLLCYNE